jgi:hypothetical protein
MQQQQLQTPAQNNNPQQSLSNTQTPTPPSNPQQKQPVEKVSRDELKNMIDTASKMTTPSTHVEELTESDKKILDDYETNILDNEDEN